MPTDDPTQRLLSTTHTIEPILSTPIPLPNRLLDFITAWTLKSIVFSYTTLLHLLSFLHLRPRPTLTKTYPHLPSSPTVRIFLPPNHNPATSPPIPLLLSIHGGAFALGAPILDDADALLYATHHNMAVASLPYRLGPLHRFPTAVHDLAALAAALLDDPSLPRDLAVDCSKNVALCGYSAGANLCLAAAQLRGLHARVRAAVAFYPVVDFSLTHEERVERGGPAVKAARNHFGWVRWGYVREGQDLRDPLVSPMFAERGRLPAKLCLVGCEEDTLCDEAERMAEGLAAGEGEGERRVDSDSGEGCAWRTRNVRWEKVMGQPHGFNQMVFFGEKRGVARRRTELMHAEVARWLFEEVFV